MKSISFLFFMAFTFSVYAHDYKAGDRVLLPTAIGSACEAEVLEVGQEAINIRQVINSFWKTSCPLQEGWIYPNKREVQKLKSVNEATYGYLFTKKLFVGQRVLLEQPWSGTLCAAMVSEISDNFIRLDIGNNESTFPCTGIENFWWEEGLISPI